MVEGFRRNSSLKSKNERFGWTPEIWEEFNKCATDIIYFAEHYFKVVTETGLEHIKLRDYQIEMLHSLQNNRFTISNQSRQSGKSETFRIFIAHQIIFNEYKTIAILADKEKTALEIMSRFKLSYQALPLWLQVGVLEFNKGSVILENNSRVLAMATTETAARGFTAQVIILDEMAHIQNFYDFYSAVYPTISAGKETKLIITSTPKGLNHFYEFWQGAITGKNGFYPIFVPWHRVPGRDEAWRLATLAGFNQDESKFDAEFNCSFLGSSGTLISGWKLKDMIDKVETPISVFASQSNLKLYANPVTGKSGQKEVDWNRNETYWVEEPHKYVLVADVSRGKGLDYHAFSVIDCSTLPYRQVATFRDNAISVADYADIVYQLAKLYNNAGVLVEINDIGEQVGYMLVVDHEYENLLYTVNNGKLGKKVTTAGGHKADKGLRVSPRTKAMGCQFLKLMLEQNKLEVIDEETVRELSTFSRTASDTYKAEEGKHDDTVMPLVLFGWLTDQPYFKEMTNIDTILNLREKKREDLKAELLPFGVIINSTVPERPGTFGVYENASRWEPWDVTDYAVTPTFRF